MSTATRVFLKCKVKCFYDLFHVCVAKKARNSLIVSVSNGIWRVPIGVTSEQNLLDVNTTSPSHVQCDSWRRRIFWAESGVNGTSIYEAPVMEIRVRPPKLVLQWKHLSIRAASPYDEQHEGPSTRRLKHINLFVFSDK